MSCFSWWCWLTFLFLFILLIIKWKFLQECISPLPKDAMHAHIRKHKQIDYKEPFIQRLKAFLCFLSLQVLTLACFFLCCEVVNALSDFFLFCFHKGKMWLLFLCSLALSHSSPHQLKMGFLNLPAQASLCPARAIRYGHWCLELGPAEGNDRFGGGLDCIVCHWLCPGCLSCPVLPQLLSDLSHVFSFPCTHPVERAVWIPFFPLLDHFDCYFALFLMQ